MVDYISAERFRRLFSDLARKMLKDQYTPQMVVGLARGATVLTTYFAYYFGLKSDKMSIAQVSKQGATRVYHNPLPEKLVRNTQVLVIEDRLETGGRLDCVVTDLIQKGAVVKTAALFCDSRHAKPDYTIGEISPAEKITFFWEIRNAVTFPSLLACRVFIYATVKNSF